MVDPRLFADDLRAVFLNEFDAMADLVAPAADAVTDPSARTTDVTAETSSVG